MKGNERRKQIIKMLSDEDKPINGRTLAEYFSVSRQVIVQDIALLRAEDYDITSTNLGYVLTKKDKNKRVFKVCHSEEQVEEELNLILDFGGIIEDVFIYHKIYGTVSAALNIKNKQDVRDFLNNLKSGNSTLLANVTSGYHYHTVVAPTEPILNLIQNQLQAHGFLAKLQDYEPVDFWNEVNDNE